MSQESENQEPINNQVNKILVVSYAGSEKLVKKLADGKDDVELFALEQRSPDGTFNFAVLKPAIDYAKEKGFHLIIAVDQESSRLSIVVQKGVGGAFMVLNSHQTAAILLQYWIQSGLYEDMKLLKSILLSDLLDNVAKKHRIEPIDQVIPANELQSAMQKVLTENESSPVVAFNIDQQVMHSNLDFEEIVAQLIKLESEMRTKEKTIYNFLLDIYFYNGFFKEKTVTIDLSIQAHQGQVSKFMTEVSRRPKFLEEIFSVSSVTDFKKGIKKNILTDRVYDYPISGENILKIETVEGVSITLVPVDDKLTYYISVRESVNTPERFESANKALDKEIFKLVSFLNKQI
ncbi:putative phosphomannomutase [Indibacter alkaliphilus LW1]|uniref:Phosphomannomutase n=1 Tax=Indibacter alkaliphilus (strain CCUG 57479 / KCTC 22604 / LW1) TaxID=1189612 RepID=S2D8Z3_INDAL|nr:phosphomannomutase [Indibacter alkaliphilus]EOZ95389.1 putative phosphomannomutase [Indibacter alkaliphilus LW1]